MTFASSNLQEEVVFAFLYLSNTIKLSGFRSVRVPFSGDTVDGRNPAPVDMVKIPLFTGFYTSQVVQDFFHQQYN